MTLQNEVRGNLKEGWGEVTKTHRKRKNDHRVHGSYLLFAFIQTWELAVGFCQSERFMRW